MKSGVIICVKGDVRKKWNEERKESVLLDSNYNFHCEFTCLLRSLQLLMF